MQNFIKKLLLGILAAAFLSVLFAVSPARAASINEAHPDGALIRLNDANKTILLIQNRAGIGIPSPSVFYSHGFSFDKVVPANQYDPSFSSNTMKYADGTIVNENGTIYIIGDGKKRGFTRSEIFKELGYDFGKTQIITPEDFYMPAFAQYPAGTPISSSSVHPEGSLIKTENGTVFLLKSGRRIAIASENVFNSYGFKWENVVPYIINDLNQYNWGVTGENDTLKFRDGTLVLDTADNRTVYVISNGKKRGVTSRQALEAYGYKWGNALRGDLSSYPAGNVINLYDETNTATVGTVDLSSDFWTDKNIEQGPEDAVIAKFVFTATAPYTIKQLTISGNKYNSDSEYILVLSDENSACVSPDPRILVAGKTALSSLDIKVTPSRPRIIAVASRAYGTKNVGDKISLSINSSSDIITDNGVLTGSFPIQGPVITTIAPAEEGDLDKGLIPVDIIGQDLTYAGFNANDFQEFFQTDKSGVWIYTLTSSLSDNITDWKNGVSMQIADFSRSKYASLDDAMKNSQSIFVTQEKGVYGEQSYRGNMGTGEQYYIILVGNIIYSFNYCAERNGAKIINLLDAKFKKSIN